MPSSVIFRWWLFILLYYIFIFHFHTYTTFSNLVPNSLTNTTLSNQDFIWLSDRLITHLPHWRPVPNWEEYVLLLNVAWVLIVWRTALTVKSRIYEWTKCKIEWPSVERSTAREEISDLNKKKEDLKDQLKRIQKKMTSITAENKLLEESCEAFRRMSMNSAEEMTQLKTSFEQERKRHQIDTDALKNNLDMITSLTQAKETTLQQKLVQEKILHNERETKLSSGIKDLEQVIKDMKMQQEKNGMAHEAQIKELLQHLANTEKMLSTTKLENEELKESCKSFQVMAANLADEMFGLKLSIEQEHKTHEDEMNTLQNKIEMMIIQMQEKETNFVRKLAEEEVRTAQANAKFSQYKDEITKVTKERQHYLKNEIRIHQSRARDNLEAYHNAEYQLNRERRKTEDLQRRLTELNHKLAENTLPPQPPFSGKDGPAQIGFQLTSKRLDVDQDSRQRHERQTAFRARRETQKYFYERRYEY